MYGHGYGYGGYGGYGYGYVAVATPVYYGLTLLNDQNVLQRIYVTTWYYPDYHGMFLWQTQQTRLLVKQSTKMGKMDRDGVYEKSEDVNVMFYNSLSFLGENYDGPEYKHKEEKKKRYGYGYVAVATPVYYGEKN
ncbi:hypothetical protein ANCCEY_04644 [Ancylostoma ceylanicum]|uniref:Uncharacterized protein n=1 Tax=Ancylostoma ceylanicum TaxID=53326 RepID=A0A0D6M8W2_9BILA|nr:hypothetical protein ANCCEY_04644 [Ancylostoma ceylanicum]